MTPLALAPFSLAAPVVALLFGFAFGFVLERSGFGDARRLAAQFYLTEMRVLKVMFTAIVTCLLLVTLASSVGLLDFAALQVNSTYLGTAVLGGLLLGAGFVIGGYCPGTSLVSAATGKVDGMVFVGGVLAGVFAFGETGGLYRAFYDNAGALGRVTLPEALGLPFGVVVALVVAMAALMFRGATVLERRFGGSASTPPSGSYLPRRRSAALFAGSVAVVALAAAFLARPATGEGAVDERARLLGSDLDATLASRGVHADPLEVLGLMHGEIRGKPSRFRLVLLDLRSDADWNRFHLLDARRATLDSLRGEQGKALAGPEHARTVVVLISNDEAAAAAGWRLLKAQGVAHAYVLAGGVNLWLDVFKEGRLDAVPADSGADRMRHAFPASLGDRHEFARPAADLYRRLFTEGKRACTPRVVPVSAPSKGAGGCG